jgi:HEAT repeat protein
VDPRELQSIELDLQSADEEIRRLAVERLAALPPDTALPRLVGCLGDAGWRVRKAAVERLAEAPAGWPVAEALVAALSDGENPGRRNAAVEALVRRGDSAVDVLLEATGSEDHDVRKLAVDTLAGIGAPRAADRLLALLDDPDPNVQAAAADALGALGDAARAPALLGVATRRGVDRLVAFSALQALARLAARVPAADLRPALADALLRPAALAVLGRADPVDGAALEALLKGLVSTSRAAREAAMGAILVQLARRDGAEAQALVEQVREAAAGEPFSEELERLEAAEPSARLVRVQFFGLLGRAEAALPILHAGADEALAEAALGALASLGPAAERALAPAFPALDADARTRACRALARTSGPVGEGLLVSALDDADAGVRTAAAGALGARGVGAVLPALVRRLEIASAAEDGADQHDEVAALSGALAALVERAADPALHGRAVELLAERLTGAPEPVRLALAAVLGRIGRPSDAALVEWLLKDPSAGVRRAAVQALARLECGLDSEPLRLALADESPAVRIAAARALGQSTSPHALSDLERLADDEEPRVRAAAMCAIGERAARAGGPDAGPALALLESSLADEGGVALAALEALGAVGGPAAVAAARGLLGRDDPELVRAAVACVGAHGARGDLEELLPLVAHPHWAVRAEVIGALAERAVASAAPAILRRLESEQDEFVREASLRALARLEG